MNICIRVDGGSSIGMGHVVRMLALAIKLREKGHNVFFACKIDDLSNKYKDGISLIKLNKFRIIELEERYFKKQIKNIEADCILTDSYDVDEEYFNILRSQFLISGCIYDTDCKDAIKFNVDFFINADLYAIEENYKTSPCTRKLLGSKYVILRNEFLKFGNCNSKVINSIKNILITLGGGNSYIYLKNILKNIVTLKQYNFYVILGRGITEDEKIDLKEKFISYSNIYFFYDVKDIWNIMIKCDLAISSCGTTLYELMYMGVPTIGVVTARNQVVMAKYCEKHDIIKIRDINNIKDTILNMKISDSIKIYKGYKNLVDGKGIDRIIEVITDLYNKKSLEA